MIKFILASNSPRRKELLPLCYDKEFIVIPADIDESSIKDENIENLPVKISLAKLKEILKDHHEDVILSADTMVYYNGKKYGKPKSKDEAYIMLKELNDVTHEVITGYSFYKTGYSFYKDGKIYTGKDISYVRINKMTDENILKYISTGSPFDKAGGYGIQDKMLNVSIISGSYYNVMGLPVEKLKELFKKISL